MHLICFLWIWGRPVTAPLLPFAPYLSTAFFNRNSSYNGDLQSSWRICVRFSSYSFSYSFCLLFLSPWCSSLSVSLSLWPRTKSGSLSSQIPLFYVRNWVFWKGAFWQRERAETFIAAICGAAKPEALFFPSSKETIREADIFNWLFVS